jgi:hypothetical protein
MNILKLSVEPRRKNRDTKKKRKGEYIDLSSVKYPLAYTIVFILIEYGFM